MEGVGQEGLLLPQLNFVWKGDMFGPLERALICICHHGRKKKLSLLRKKGSTEYLCLLAEEDNNTSVVSPESEILGTKSYLFIHKWKVIPFAAEVYFPCGRLKL